MRCDINLLADGSPGFVLTKPGATILRCTKEIEVYAMPRVAHKVCARRACADGLKTERDSSTLRRTTDWCGWWDRLEMLALESTVTRQAANCLDRCCSRHTARCPDG